MPSEQWAQTPDDQRLALDSVLKGLTRLDMIADWEFVDDFLVTIYLEVDRDNPLTEHCELTMPIGELDAFLRNNVMVPLRQQRGLRRV